MTNSLQPLIDTFQQLPKVDLHRHLEGALRVEALAALGHDSRDVTDEQLIALRKRVTHSPDDPHDPTFFLSRFKALREFFVDQEAITHLTRNVIADAAGDNVRYLELRLTPAAIASQGNFSLDEATEWVLQAANGEAENHKLTVRYLLSFNRHEPVALADEVLEIALAQRGSGVVGLDLAGDERNHPAEPFAKILQKGREHGLGVSVHAGEWGDSREIDYAIERLGATRIGHGVHVLGDLELAERARKTGVCFEVSLTSNVRTGSVPAIGEHPLPAMLQAGLQIALTTDDPGIFGTTLSEECTTAVRELGLSVETVKGMTLSAIQASFLDKKTKQIQERELVQAIWGGGAP